jgi:hypothetical protein
MISLQKEVCFRFVPSARTRLIPLILQALLEHLNQFGVDFFDFAWDDTVEVSAAAHVYTAAPADADGNAQEGSIAHPSSYQRVPWSPLTLDLSLQRGLTYLLAAHPPALSVCEATLSVSHTPPLLPLSPPLPLQPGLQRAARRRSPTHFPRAAPRNDHIMCCAVSA